MYWKVKITRYCVMLATGYMGGREGFGTQPRLNFISCTVSLIPLNGCGSNSPLWMGQLVGSLAFLFSSYFSSFVNEKAVKWFFTQTVLGICQFSERQLLYHFYSIVLNPEFFFTIKSPLLMWTCPHLPVPGCLSHVRMRHPVKDRRFSCYWTAFCLFLPCLLSWGEWSSIA